MFVIEYLYDATRTDEMDRLRPSHRQFLGALADEGVVAAGGPSPLSDTEPAALVIVNGDDPDAALRALDADPFWEAGLILERRVRPFTAVVGGFAQ